MIQDSPQVDSALKSEHLNSNSDTRPSKLASEKISPNFYLKRKQAQRKRSIFNFKTHKEKEEHEILQSYKQHKMELKAKIENKKLIPIKALQLNLDRQMPLNFPPQMAGSTIPSYNLHYFRSQKSKETNSAKKIMLYNLIQNSQNTTNKKDLECNPLSKLIVSGKFLKMNNKDNMNQILPSKEEAKRTFTPDIIKLKNSEKFLIKKGNFLNSINLQEKKGEFNQVPEVFLKKSHNIPSLFKH